MIRKDYIIRMIERFGMLWAQVVLQLRSGLLGDARATLDIAYKELLGLNLDAVRTRSSGELLARMQFGASPEEGAERTSILTALLQAEGDLANAENDPDRGAFFYQKALDIVLALRLSQTVSPLTSHAPNVAELAEKLSDYDLPFDTNALLLQFYEQQGAFAQAEDRLFELAENAGNTDAAATLGEAFYDRLEQQDDSALAAGNFSRAEINAGRAALRHIVAKLFTSSD